MAGFKKTFEGCLPPPPPMPVQAILSPTETACHNGYKIGFSQGKQWALLISRSNGKFKEGKHELRCLMSWLKKNQNIHNICAMNGAKSAYEKFFSLAKQPEKLKQFERDQNAIQLAKAENQAYYKQIERAIAQD